MYIAVIIFFHCPYFLIFNGRCNMWKEITIDTRIITYESCCVVMVTHTCTYRCLLPRGLSLRFSAQLYDRAYFNRHQLRIPVASALSAVLLLSCYDDCPLSAALSTALRSYSLYGRRHRHHQRNFRTISSLRCQTTRRANWPVPISTCPVVIRCDIVRHGCSAWSLHPSHYSVLPSGEIGCVIHILTRRISSCLYLLRNILYSPLHIFSPY